MISPNEIVCGASASAQIEGYMFVILDSFCIANVAFTGQNFGVKNVSNIKKCYWYSLIWIFIGWLFCLVIIFSLYQPLLSIFINTKSEGIIKDNAILAGFERLRILTMTEMLNGWMDLNGSYLKGMKKSTAPAIVTAIGCTGTRILFLLTLFKTPTFHTIFWLYAAFPISWILVNIVYIPIIIVIQKKQFKLLEV